MRYHHALALPVLPLSIAATGSASAHPHIFVDARATIPSTRRGPWSRSQRVDVRRRPFRSGRSRSRRQVDGVTSPDEMQSLPDENLTALADFGFYTSVDPQLTVVPVAPYRIGQQMEIGIADPAY